MHNTIFHSSTILSKVLCYTVHGISYICYTVSWLWYFFWNPVSNSKSNTMEDINGDINKYSSQDIINRDIGKKELPMITLFRIRLQYSASIFYYRQRETGKWYVILVSGSEKHHVTDASSEIKTKGKFLKIDDQG